MVFSCLTEKLIDPPGKSCHWVFFTDVRLIQNGTQWLPKQLDTSHCICIAKFLAVAPVPSNLSLSTHTTLILTNVT